MDWLKPHIARIDQYCASLKNNSAYMHTPNPLKHRLDVVDYQVYTDDDIDSVYNEKLIRLQNIKEYTSQIKPVSVIVADKSGSGSVSPSSSLSDGWSHSNDKSSNEDNSTEESNDCSQNKKQKCDYNYKPVPMVRKSRRRFISPEQKDANYWERRRRNNEAAKKSREQRREKEIEVNRKCSKLEQENSSLQFTVLNLQERNAKIQNTLQMYKEILLKNNLL